MRRSALSGDEIEGSVVGALIEYLNNPLDCGQIVFATQQAFSMVPFVANRGDWHVFVDEAMEVHRHKHHLIRDSHRVLTEEIETKRHNMIYSRIVPMGETS